MLNLHRHLMGAALASAAASLLHAPAQAQVINKGITGGTCTFVQQLNAIRLDKCVNNLNVTVNDLHVDVSYAGNIALPRVVIDVIQPRFFDVISYDFGPAVKAGGTWEGQGGSNDPALNIPVWSNPAIGAGNFVPGNVKVSGHWTFDGKELDAEGNVVQVPEPATQALMLAGLLGLAGWAARRRQAC